jgi:hypothetical protein
MPLRLRGGISQHAHYSGLFGSHGVLGERKHSQIARSIQPARSTGVEHLTGGRMGDGIGVMGAKLRGRWDDLGRAVQRRQLLSLFVATASFFALAYAAELGVGALWLVSDAQQRKVFAACLVSCVHSITVSLLAYEELCTRGWRPFGFTGAINEE